MQRAGLIRKLTRQVPFDLYACNGELIAQYVADFVYEARREPEIGAETALETTNGVGIEPMHAVSPEAAETNVSGPEKAGIRPSGWSWDTSSGWSAVVEDVKGGQATKTRLYLLKRKLLRAQGVEITEV
jgi:hypothetical protein